MFQDRKLLKVTTKNILIRVRRLGQWEEARISKKLSKFIKLVILLENEKRCVKSMKIKNISRKPWLMRIRIRWLGLIVSMNMLRLHQQFLESEDQQQFINLSRFNMDLLWVKMRKVKEWWCILLIHLTNHVMWWVIYQEVNLSLSNESLKSWELLINLKLRLLMM